MRSVIIILFFISTVGWIWQGGVAKKNRDGVRLYNKGEIDHALSKWRDAQIESPDKEELHYNIGSALYRQKKYEDAFKEFEKALETEDAELQARTYYNIGNTNYRMGRLPEAIESYQKVIELNPDDEDARYNIEFIRKKLEEMENQQEVKKEEGREGQAQEQQARQQEMQEGDRSEEEQRGAQEKEGEEETTEEKTGEEEETGDRGAFDNANGRREMKDEDGEGLQEMPGAAKEDREGQMSEEDAIRLLDALKDDEKELQRQLRMQAGEDRYRVEKDW